MKLSQIPNPAWDAALEAARLLIQAHKHFDRAVEAALARNDAAFASEMAAFNAIKETWKPREARAAEEAAGHTS